jgi:hypothetical protein
MKKRIHQSDFWNNLIIRKHIRRRDPLATRELLTPSQRQQFYDIPDNMDQRELARYYTITPEEKSVINQQRGASNRAGKPSWIKRGGKVKPGRSKTFYGVDMQDKLIGKMFNLSHGR